MTRTVGGLIIAVALLTAADAIVNAASCAATPISASPPTSAPASESSAPSATPTAPGSSSTAPPGRDAALDAAVQRAIDVATARGERAAVTVYDRWTATLYSAGDYLDSYSSASVMKIAIAGELLARGALADYEDTAWDMIARSNDAAADALYELAGGDAVMVTFASRYGLDSYFGRRCRRAGGAPPGSRRRGSRCCSTRWQTTPWWARG